MLQAGRQLEIRLSAGKYMCESSRCCWTTKRSPNIRQICKSNYVHRTRSDSNCESSTSCRYQRDSDESFRRIANGMKNNNKISDKTFQQKCCCPDHALEIPFASLPLCLYLLYPNLYDSVVCMREFSVTILLYFPFVAHTVYFRDSRCLYFLLYYHKLRRVYDDLLFPYK